MLGRINNAEPVRGHVAVVLCRESGINFAQVHLRILARSCYHAPAWRPSQNNVVGATAGDTNN